MKVRTDVAELLRQGFNNTEIAEQTGLHKRTIGEARRRLGLPNATRRRKPTNLERLYLEAVPTGRVKEYRPTDGRMPLSPAQQLANRERLLAALRDEAA